MALTYKTCTEGVIPDYMCEPCDVVEKGRVRGIFLLHKSIYADAETVATPGTAKNIEKKAWWETQVEAGLIIIVPKTRGTYDGGTQNKVTGFGDKKEQVASKTHSVTFFDKNHSANEEFYASIEDGCENYHMGWRTETEIRLGRTPMTGFEAKDPVEEDTESILTWQGIASWVQSVKKTVPIYSLGEVKEVFNCIENSQQ